MSSSDVKILITMQMSVLSPPVATEINFPRTLPEKCARVIYVMRYIETNW